MIDFNFKKKYGQNFLIDNNIVLKIVNVIEDKSKSLVIEIGCGDGRLTRELCKCFDNVLGYEIDLEVKDNLYNNLSCYNNYKIIFSDFLNVDIESDIKGFDYDNLYVMGNLPYYITTPIIEKIITSKIDVSKMVFMVQKEVGDRIGAKVGSRDYSSLTVFLNYYFNIKKEFVVSRNCFYPKPNVDSMIISFTKKENKLFVKDEDLFFKLVRDSFRFKRKTLRNNLKEYDLDKISVVLSKYNLDLTVRAENISLEVFCDIANFIS